VIVKNSKRKLWQKIEDVRVEYDFDEQPWLQLMCCASVSSREVVVYFRMVRMERSRRRRDPKEVN